MIAKTLTKTSLYLLLIPLLYILLYSYLIMLHGPFYLTRIDPDYVYLLNGMNCSILHFDRIGHVHHPGTPFQVFLGLCIDIIYIFSGKGAIVSDVLSRPEHYLSWCSHIMAILFFLTIVWAGKIGKKYAGWAGAATLQLSPFLSPIMLDLSVRIMADRFAMMLVFVLIIFLIRGYSSVAGNGKQVASLGILSGLIIATKISFMPVLVIPFLVLKKRFIWVLTTLLGFFIGILPIINRTSEFSTFITNLISHDGIYGSGAEQFIDYRVFIHHVWIIIQSNVLLVLLLILCFGYLLSDLIKRKSIWKNEGLFQLAFTASAVLSILLVAKHYKNYYMVPILMTMGSCLSVVIKRLNNQLPIAIILLVVIFFTTLSIHKEVSAAQTKNQEVSTRLKAAEELENFRTSENYFIIKPEWLWGLSKEYGIIFGLSYVHHRFTYQPEIDHIYPQTLSYEGPDHNMSRMRLGEISDSALIAHGRTIFLVDQEGRNAKEIIEDLGRRLQYHSVDSSRLSNGDTIYQLEPRN